MSCQVERGAQDKIKTSVGTHDISTKLVRNSISTKRGDSGETSLLYGGRVAKSSRRVAASGIGDETASILGLARAHCDSGRIHNSLLEIQRLIFLANAEMATDSSQLDQLQTHFQRIGEEHVAELDNLLGWLEEELELPPAFIIPGASVASATLDVARCKIREMERAAVGLYEDGLLENEQILIWLNRLSDCVFMMARYADRELPSEIVTGTRRES